MTAMLSSAGGLGVLVDSHSPGVVFATDLSFAVGGDSVYCRSVGGSSVSPILILYVSLMEGLLPEALF